MGRKILVSVAVFFSLSLSVAAQEPNRSRGQGYVFFAPGIGNLGPGKATLQIGAGGEGFIYKGFGIGAEIGPVGPWSAVHYGQYSLGWIDNVVGLGSANLSYHLLPGTTDHALEPFVTAGYSMFFRAGISQGSNFGGGVNVWLSKDIAMRFEVRDHESWWRRNVGFRLGVTFR